MAGSAIKSNDIFDDNLLTKAQSGFEKLAATLGENEAALKRAAIAASTFLGKLNEAKDSEGLALYNKAMQDSAKIVRDATKNRLDQIAIEKAYQQARQATIKADALQRKETEAGTKETEKATKETAKATKENEKNVGTINQMRKANSELTKERNMLNLATEEGRLRLVAINKELDKNNQFLKGNVSEMEKERLSVGGYAAAIQEALGANKLFGNTFTEMGRRMQGVREILKGIKAQMGGKEAGAGAAASDVNTGGKAAETVATEADTIAVNANTIAQEKNALVTGEVAVVEGANVVALEAETVATGEAAVATGALSTALAFLKANPILIVIAAIVAAGTAIYEYAKRTQEGEDAIDAFTAKTKAQAEALTTLGGDMEKAGAAAEYFTTMQQILRDHMDQNILVFAELGRRAAQARLDAEQENVTTEEKIKLLQKVIDTKTELSESIKVEALQNFAAAAGIKDLTEAEELLNKAKENGGVITRDLLKANFGGIEFKEEQLKKVIELGQKVVEIETEHATALKKVTKQEVSLRQKYKDDTLKMQQEEAKEELEAIRITAKTKIGIIEQTYQKEQAISREEYNQKRANLEKEQAKLGSDLDGVSKRAEFDNELLALKHLFNSKSADLAQKRAYDIDREQHEEVQKAMDFHKKIIDENNKYQDELSRSKSEAISNDHDRLVSQLNDEYTIKQRAAAEKYASGLQANANGIGFSNEAKQHELYNAEKLANDSEYNKKRADLEADTAAKHSADLEREAANYAQGLKQEEDMLRQSLEAKGVNEVTISKKMRKKREADLKAEIIDRHNRGLSAEAQEKELGAAQREDKKDAHEEEMKQISEITDAIEMSLQRKNKLLEQQLNNDLEMRQRNIMQQQQLAAEGYGNTLALEKANASKDELRKQQLAIREKKEAMAIAVFKLLAANADKEDGAKALIDTFVQMGIAEAFSAKFAKGVEGLQGPGTETSDSIPALLSKNESVITAAGTKEYAGLPTAINKGKVDEYFEQKFLPKYLTEFENASFGENVLNSILLKQSVDQQAVIIKKTDELIREIKNKPVPSMSIDKDGIVSQKQHKNGLISVIRYKPRNNNLI